MHRTESVTAVILSGLSLGSVGLLFAWDLFPSRFPARAHDLLGAVPLVLIALAYLIRQITRRASAGEFARSLILVVAFWFWAANQFWPELKTATLLNDVAISLFVLDVVLIIIADRPGAD